MILGVDRVRTFAKRAMTAGIAGFAGLVGVAIGDAQATGFMPHRAVYDLTLQSAETASGIAALSGKMVFEVQGSACEGYSVEFRLITQITATNGTVRMTDVRTSSFEKPDGDGFQFLSQTFLDQKKTQESRGEATRDGAGMQVALSKPSEKSVSFDEAIMFPSQHFQEIIRRAQAGDRFLSVGVYDGSEEGETFFETSTVIGNPRDIEDPAGQPAIESKTHWPVVISYFEPKSGQVDTTPIYTLSFLTNAPGISRDLKMDYNAFAIKGTLAELERFEVAACP